MRASQRTQKILMPAVPGHRLRTAFVLVYLTDQLMRRLVITPEADADITNAAVWYALRDYGLGIDFLSDIQQSIRDARRRPEAFPRVRKKPEVRRILTKRFPYRIFVILIPNELVVFAVLHAARNEKIWRQRLRQS